MTTTEAHSATTCPQCRGNDSIEVEEGRRLCLACRHEWSPADVDWAKVPPKPAPAATPHDADDNRAILAAGNADDVLAHVEPLPTPEEVAPTPVLDGTPDWSGNFVEHTDNDGLTATYLCVEDDGRETITIASEDGAERIVLRSRCTLAADRHPSETTAPEGEGVEYEPLAAVVLMVSSLCLTVGLQCVGEDEEHTLATPLTGWMPPPADGIPEAEQGAAYAVALLIRAFDLDRDAITTMALNLMTGAEAGTTEGE